VSARKAASVPLCRKPS